MAAEAVEAVAEAEPGSGPRRAVVRKTITIDARFNGPPDSANGGYACGVVGTSVEGAAVATLRKPPPLDVAMELEVVEASSTLLREGELIAEAETAALDLDVPRPPTPAQAEIAAESYAGLEHHQYPTCFVCGPRRESGDGLRIFPGAVEGRELVAGVWKPDPSLPVHGKALAPEIIWAALDCPTYFGGRLRGYPASSVLGRLTARIDRPLETGRSYVVVGWPLGKEERKWSGGSAIFMDTGELCACARGLWIEPKG